MSADSSLRLSTLKVLAASGNEIWETCVEIESSEMSLRNVRERTMAIAKLSRAITSSSEVPQIQSVITYLVAQLKVNFRPVYAETITALSALSSRYSESIWSVIWSELERTNAADCTTAVDLGVVNPSWCGLKGEDILVAELDQEKEFSCPNLEKGQMAVFKAWGQSTDGALLDNDEIQVRTSLATVTDR